jgi:hypothetical protein
MDDEKCTWGVALGLSLKVYLKAIWGLSRGSPRLRDYL